MEEATNTSCPTCGAKGSEPCVRGRWFSDVWRMRIPYPEGHEPRRKANASYIE